MAKLQNGAPAVRIGDIGETSLDQHVDRLYGAEVRRVIASEISDLERLPDEKAAIERALSPDFWSSFHATDRLPIISDHDPLDRFQPINPFDITTLAAHKDRARKLDWIRRQSFLSAVHSLIQQIANGEIAVVGRREPVETVDQPWEELPFGALQDQRWKLCRGQSRVQVLDEYGGVVSTFREVRLRERDVRRLSEPSSEIGENSEPRQVLKTGASGRPTSMYLVQAEHSRRIIAGEAQKILAQEARYLEAWKASHYPDHPPLGTGRIETGISEAHNQYKAKHPE